MQCVAVCYSVLQCAAVCCSVLQCVAVCCSVLQCIAVCCSALKWIRSMVLRYWNMCNFWRVTHDSVATHCNTLQHTATHCNTLQHTSTTSDVRHMSRLYMWCDDSSTRVIWLINWFWLPIFRTNFVRGLSNKVLKFRNKGKDLVQIALVLISQPCNQNQSIQYTCDMTHSKEHISYVLVTIHRVYGLGCGVCGVWYGVAWAHTHTHTYIHVTINRKIYL